MYPINKFKIGDYVYFPRFNYKECKITTQRAKVWSKTTNTVETSPTDIEVHIDYTVLVEDSHDYYQFRDDQIFPTRDAAKNSPFAHSLVEQQIKFKEAYLAGVYSKISNTRNQLIQLGKEEEAVKRALTKIRKNRK